MGSAQRKSSILPLDRLLQARIDALQFTREYEDKCFGAAHGGVGYRWERAEVYQGYVICSVEAGDTGGYIYLVVSPHYECHPSISGFDFNEDRALAAAKAKVDAQAPVGYQWTKAEIYRGHVICSVDIDAADGWLYLIISPHYQQNFPILGKNTKGRDALTCAAHQIDERYEKRALQIYLQRHPDTQFLGDEAIGRLVGLSRRELQAHMQTSRPFRPAHLQRQVLQRQLPTDVYFHD